MNKKDQSRIQIPNAPDLVIKMVLTENLGTHLKAAMRGRIEIDNATVVALNSGKKASRVSTILTLIAAELEEYLHGAAGEKTPSMDAQSGRLQHKQDPASPRQDPPSKTSSAPPTVDVEHFR